MLTYRFTALMTAIVVGLLAACASEINIRDQHSLEYLNSVPGKPLIYPADVKPLQQGDSYHVPDLPSSSTGAVADLSDQQPPADYDLNELAKPPRLVEKPLSKKEIKAAAKAGEAEDDDS